MAKTKFLSEKGDVLRSRAEKLLAKKGKSAPEKLPRDVQKLIHELGVHQVELEMQNEELRRTELELAESKNKYVVLYDFAPTGYFTFDQKGRIVEVNLTGACQLGVERGSLINKPFSLFVMPEFRNLFHTFQQRVSETGAQQSCELRLMKKDGSSFYASMLGMMVQNPEREMMDWRCALIDITDRKRAEEELKQRTLELEHLTETLEERVKERTAELANLSSELLVTQEKERRRISYDLHDNVWQTLDFIKFQIEHLFSRENEADWPAFHRKAKQLIPVIQNTVARVRSMQGDLWPSVLDDIGIVPTLEWYCREFVMNHPGLGIEKNVGLAEDEVPTSAKIVIYRVMQEALSNVAKHSQASHVSLSLVKSDHSLEFIIKDNGIGFDPEEAIVKRSPWGGLGILSIKHRTELSGGLFGVESAKGKGTTIRASWLLNGNN